MITFLFENLRLDGNVLKTDWDLLVRLVADFSIIIPAAHIPLYREEEFCVVEFAMQITEWLSSLQESPIDFSYNSMESDEAGLVSINRREGGWAVSALHQDLRDDRVLSTEQIKQAVDDFVVGLKNEVGTRFQRDISHLVSGRPRSL